MDLADADSARIRLDLHDDFGRGLIRLQAHPVRPRQLGRDQLHAQVGDLHSLLLTRLLVVFRLAGRARAPQGLRPYPRVGGSHYDLTPGTQRRCMLITKRRGGVTRPEAVSVAGAGPALGVYTDLEGAR